ncbi:D-alanyl-D-alanine carboxypeptidase [Paenibacillus sp. N1-5-1-14]|uniref:D-alanyl-D-alanine carboxypeptidase family protein n=1 Tax=Paenibacillus radicibacter TaxID=2972488 RepID=UPI002158CC8E|nr:D-alanyl-D-alanine carboxypeptidase family protein [Paenibacillus radicibacter]MCR8642340.1 D-alanyl-D-alanine carboxypeptidase [Paenibacillus radicibacter]
MRPYAKKWLMLTLIISLCLTVIVPSRGAFADESFVMDNAKGAALIDVTSGRILYGHNADKPMLIASLTKVMTAIVAIENGNLSSAVTISMRAAGKEGSSLYLKLGQVISLNQLLQGMMLRSGNDAATAVAEHIGGSVEGFVYMMNEKAQMLGMTQSTFANPTGLEDNGVNKSSAADMAKLTAYALHNPVFQEIVKTKEARVPNPNDGGNYLWQNKNKMLRMYEGADGVKTGFTKLARRCLISSATRGGQQLAVVTLNDSDDWADHAQLLNYGFKNFPLVELTHKGDQIDQTGWVAGRSFLYPLRTNEQSGLTHTITPYQVGSTDEQLGRKGLLNYQLNGKEIGRNILYEPNSPYLTMDAQATMGFKATEVHITKLKRFVLMWKNVFHRLVTLL